MDIGIHSFSSFVYRVEIKAKGRRWREEEEEKMQRNGE